MTYSLVQKASPQYGAAAAATGGTSGSFATPATAGRLLIAELTVNKNNAADAASAGYTLLAEWLDTAGAYNAILGKIAVGGETNAALTWTGSGYAVINLYEYDGGPATLAGIVAEVAKNTGNSNTPSVSAAGVAAAGSLVLVVHGRVSRNALLSGPTGGFTADDDTVSSGGTASTGAGATATHKILSASETPSTAITLGNTRQWNSLLVVLKPASTGSAKTVKAWVSGAWQTITLKARISGAWQTVTKQ